MAVFKTILSVLFVIAGIALTAVVLMQEGKSAGLSGSISGAAETYWGRNKGRSMEGRLVTATRVLVIIFLVIAVILNIDF